MGSSSASLFFLLTGAALVVSVLASATSAALAALGEHRVASIFEDSRQGRAPRGLAGLVARPDAVRLSLIALDTLGKLVLGLALARAFVDLPVRVAWAVAVGGTLGYLVLLAAARALAARAPDRSLVWAAPVATGVEILLRPLVAPLAALARLVRGPDAPALGGTTEELEYLIEKGARSGELDEGRRDLLESVIEFSNVRVREIMVPRPRVVALPIDAPKEEVLRVVVESGHSRLPVYEDSVDNVVGVLYAKRLLADLTAEEPGRSFRLAQVIQAPFFVPETMKISHLLAEFQRRGLQMAVVVDEFGGTSGVVTLEDVMEEIVGDIRDEADREEQQPIRQLAPGVFVAEGEASIRDVEFFLEEALEGYGPIEFPDEGDYETIGGFVTALAGRVPRVGEQFVHDGLLFTVREADEKRVARVEISLRREEGERDRADREDRETASSGSGLGRAVARIADAPESSFFSRFAGLRREA